jgi:hypothetical protein
MRSQAALFVVLSLGYACVLHEASLDIPETTATDGVALTIDCSELPPYDLPSLDCDQLSNAFESTIRAAHACNGPSDCQLIRPRCETWGEVSCYYAANFCIDPQQLEMFDAEAESCSAGYSGCECEEEPTVDCVNHMCVLISG